MAALTAVPARGVDVAHASFGTLPDGRDVPAVTLVNAHGVRATVIAWGATLQSLILPDRDGNPADVTLGYDTLQDYLDHPQFFGATVGRFANRIARGRFTLDGTAYQVPVNDGANALHGGTEGFDKQLWQVTDAAGGAQGHVTLRHVSPDGDMGYPGAVTIEATYTLDADDRLTIEYRATTDAQTIINITNHAYWNLAGEGSASGAMGHRVTIAADAYVPTDAGSIPTGEVRPVAGTAFDFRTGHIVGDRVRDATEQQLVFGRGYDHTFVLTRQATADEHLVARVADPHSGRAFELWSNQPGVQFYTGNFLDGTTRGKARRIYRQGDAVVFEPQLFPDTPNQPAFGSARLAPGETYRNLISYRFFTLDP
ncbi:MAG: galactose mutarotase [Sphingomonadaceae bacterium]|nr:galactose mutarotase [Sphingomonadaceae bacterium]